MSVSESGVQPKVQPKVLASREEAVEAAKAVRPMLSEKAIATERNRSALPEVIEAMTDAGLFGVMTPKRWGGSELGFETMLAVQIQLASACSSTGWVYGVLAGHTWLAALFSEQAQADVFANPRSLVASLIRLGGTAPTKVEGGYRWEGGEGRFCSGIDHSDWILVGGQVPVDDGVEPTYFLLPIDEVDIIDDWHAIGLKGTGSKSIRVRDSFIPEYRAVKFSDMAAGTAPGAETNEGPVYRLPYDCVWPLSLVGAPLGAALGAVETFTDATSKRVTPLPPMVQAAQGTALARLAKAAAMTDAAIGLVISDARAADAATGPEGFDQVERARRARNFAYAAQQARAAVNHLYEASGGSGVYEGPPMQRWFRDVNAAASHVAFTWDLASVAYGREACGLTGADSRPGPGVKR